ncbi:MAG: hypothetical protein KI790_13065 [Cyclobacteriaceae bacterium]|nr:hypothetical protein [Cyclobacteriaceae bacterium HetDA_MAG_MS6]
MLAAIDYGSKLAGTTVIAFSDFDKIDFHQSKIKKDADVFLHEILRGYSGKEVFIDAPLSLPLVYTREVSSPNFFYRKCDVVLQAMSPMFLGGLTARAMRLKYELAQSGLQLMETYPGFIARNLDLDQMGYKKEPANMKSLVKCIEPDLPGALQSSPINWHQFDALLALIGATRYARKIHQEVGNPEEGIIYI